MITLEQRYDRWERIACRCYEASVREIRESRQQTKKLKLSVDAQTEWYAALHSLEELPANSERKERLLRARQVLDQARQEVKRSFHCT
jgi:hypothetical protein